MLEPKNTLDLRKNVMTVGARRCLARGTPPACPYVLPLVRKPKKYA